MVQMKLDGLWTPMIRLHGHVGPDRDDPARYTMGLDTGPGFLNVVWHEIALWLCRLDEVYICAGCDQPYQRSIRKPRQDQDNFCPACRQGSKASNGCGQRGIGRR